MHDEGHKAKEPFRAGGPFTSGRGASRGLRGVREYFGLSDREAKELGETLYALSYGLGIILAGTVIASRL